MVKRAKLGNIILDVVQSENPVYANEVTENPVERGLDIADHVKNKPVSFTITGVCAGPEAPKKIAALRIYRNTGTLLTYIGRNILKDYVITNLDTVHDVEVRDGFKFTITLQEVRIAVAKQVPFTTKDPVTKKSTKSQTKKVTSRGRVQPQKRSQKKYTKPQQVSIMQDSRKNRKTVYDGIG